MENNIQTIQNDDFEEDNCITCLKENSGKFGITVSILGGVGAILIPHFTVLGAVVIGITNIGVFFTGLAYEQLKNKNNNIKKDFMKMKKEKIKIERRLTTYNFPNNENDSEND